MGQKFEYTKADGTKLGAVVELGAVVIEGETITPDSHLIDAVGSDWLASAGLTAETAEQAILDRLGPGVTVRDAWAG